MKKEILLAAVLSALFHMGLLLGGGSGKAESAATVVTLTADSPKDAPPPPPPPPPIAPGDSDEEVQPEAILPEEMLSPGLNEPPASSASIDALTQFVKPEPPHEVRTDTLAVGIPTGAQRSGGTGAKAAIVFSTDQLDHPPEVRYQPAPQYPYELRMGGVEGQVDLKLYVDTNGRVFDVEVARATNPGFINAAMEAVRRWRFEPGLRKGKAVNFVMLQPIPFRLASR
jgi:protein TonB